MACSSCEPGCAKGDRSLDAYGPALSGNKKIVDSRLLPEIGYPLTDLSPKPHPLMSRVRSSFEPVWLGGATGRGAKPGSERSVPSRCMAEALSLA